jgi:hypothetical protein
MSNESINSFTGSQEEESNSSNNNFNNVSRLFIERETFNEITLNERYSFQKFQTENALRSSLNYIKKNYSPGRYCLSRFARHRFPIFEWIKKYDIKQNLLKDFISGLTIGVVQIPQSMAYSMMANLPPVNGLYVAFFTVLIYFFFGTSRHLSLGTYGIVSLMVASTIEKYEGKLYPHSTAEAVSRSVSEHGGGNGLAVENSLVQHADNHRSISFLSDDPEQAKITIAATLAFMVGIIQVMSLFLFEIFILF